MAELCACLPQSVKTIAITYTVGDVKCICSILQSFRKGVGAARRDKNKGRSQGLTEEQKQEIREAFDLFDTDGSGTYPTVLRFLEFLRDFHEAE